MEIKTITHSGYEISMTHDLKFICYDLGIKRSSLGGLKRAIDRKVEELSKQAKATPFTAYMNYGYGKERVRKVTVTGTSKSKPWRGAEMREYFEYEYMDDKEVAHGSYRIDENELTGFHADDKVLRKQVNELNAVEKEIERLEKKRDGINEAISKGGLTVEQVRTNLGLN